ncbi:MULTISPECIES: ribosome hibernation-promoting factor, HPF/YfiA family [Leeuwenhoekiella]|uniref:Sigma-54 modulation protein n=1 Tax=Leeuwenhoekiella palythoae TaxID=573501 RepID=A0A1M5Z337_9FLAO|nr:MULTISPECIES: ribosome-associated translation inhibitor RaiA [Leeuwenhoekiella]MAS19481.1 ribosomal subunit interface protein [Leeuwenhoekiella sp.]MEC7785122.1 ribosome-associated translation inhibitor RaiA [Bacteroidota bacterium]MBH12352.1 ribosomal subunit interface protein [Leeuwenhoekiella sp.]MEE3147057.1 ribosome-associated translation inhibitor RaiA [Bacteroidota bacterium]MEE3225829.1 ribosome-associated translation inhibitor RaiA [Bacteroidota bacterium]|tara:strand:+ start:470 stop:772 length:303 start_codon:yes stop_codon:yes gene_type:complete
MKVNVQTPHFVADQKLINFIQKKMDKLEKFYDHIIYADVFLKLENTSDRQNKIVEILLSVPGNELIVKKQAKSFEEGADNCAHSLERLLMRRKQKIRASA